eukprot:366001-Chlamydomonas_euryale.AAC.9
MMGALATDAKATKAAKALGTVMTVRTMIIGHRRNVRVARDVGRPVRLGNVSVRPRRRTPPVRTSRATLRNVGVVTLAAATIVGASQLGSVGSTRASSFSCVGNSEAVGGSWCSLGRAT